MQKSNGERVFSVFNGIFLLFIICTVVFPLAHILSISLSEKQAIINQTVGLLPKGLRFDAYKYIFLKPAFLTSLANTVGLTAAYVFTSILVCVMAAYALSKDFYGKRLVTYIFIITMYFSGGLIPSYLLITKYLKLYNTYWALLIPGLVNVFYIIVIRSQIEAIPPSLSEAAIVDGANEFQVLINVIIPSVSATIAAIGMFLALSMWNMWFPVMIYTNKESLWTLQYFLRAVIFDKFLTAENTAVTNLFMDATDITPQNFQMAAIVLVALPIVSIYPFVQKYFVKGILVGSVKE